MHCEHQQREKIKKEEEAKGGISELGAGAAEA
jgi:hypothetical protein